MNKAKSYRCRQTGKVLYAADIPDRWMVSRYLPPKVKQFGKWVQPRIQRIFPPALEENYDPYLFDLADIDPIQPDLPPVHDEFIEFVELGEPVERMGAWHENWEVKEKFPTTEKLRGALIDKINTMAMAKRNRGIVHGTIAIQTDLDGLNLLETAHTAAEETTDFVIGRETHKVSRDQVVEMRKAAALHIQNTFTEEANLIRAVKKSANPTTIDLSVLE